MISHIACSGATIKSLTNTFNSEPGQIDQLGGLASPGIVTITLGGNNIGFADILTTCATGGVTGGGCVGAAQSAEFNINRPHGLIYELTQAYGQIRQAEPNARIVVVGYPNIFPTTQASAVNCGWLTREDRAALVHLASVLDEGIKRATQQAHVGYKSVLDVLAGHEECTADSWMYPLGHTSTSTFPYMGHPLYNGQHAIMVAVDHYLNGGV